MQRGGITIVVPNRVCMRILMLLGCTPDIVGVITERWMIWKIISAYNRVTIFPRCDIMENIITNVILINMICYVVIANSLLCGVERLVEFLLMG
jgi:hypothetical protein